jgi:Uma2 family endonuclease
MSDPVPARMTTDAFIAWAMEQPEGQHYELEKGRIIAMAPERGAHAKVKFHVARRLAEAIEKGGLPCEVYPDGMAVQIDETTTYEPDALVRCGPDVPPDTVKLTDPIIVVEVLSPSTRARDNGEKLIGYFSVPSIRHYLLVRPEDLAIIHHARNPDGTILTRIVRDGTLVLDPPGITVTGLHPGKTGPR